MMGVPDIELVGQFSDVEFGVIRRVAIGVPPDALVLAPSTKA